MPVFIIAIFLFTVIFLATVGLLYSFPIITIYGNSMHPTYKDGEIVIGTRLFNRKKPKTGEVYVIQVPWETKKLYLKRLIYYTKVGENIYVQGDNVNESYDSNTFGWISKNCIKAKILLPKRSKSDGA